MTELERLNSALESAFLMIGIHKKADMAKYLGYKGPYFSGIINGKEKLTEHFLKNVSEKLGVNTDYILTGEGDIMKKYSNNTIVSRVKQSIVHQGTTVSGNNNLFNSENVDYLYRMMERKDEQLKRKDEQLYQKERYTIELCKQIEELHNNLLYRLDEKDAYYRKIIAEKEVQNEYSSKRIDELTNILLSIKKHE